MKMNRKMIALFVLLFLCFNVVIAGNDKVEQAKGKETPICTDPSYQGPPRIYEDKIVWEDYRNEDWDIYMYDLTTNKEMPICTVKGEQASPDIYENRIVWHDHP